jgi:hypothetical protein
LNWEQLVDVILVKKSFSDRRRRRRRKWKLNTVVQPTEQKKKDVEAAAADYENFLRDLEEDPELRSNINIYKDPTVGANGTESEARCTVDRLFRNFCELRLYFGGCLGIGARWVKRIGCKK